MGDSSTYESVLLENAVLKEQLAAAKQALFVSSAECSGMAMDEPRRALVDHMRAIASVLNGASIEMIPEAHRTEPLRAVVELRHNYDELWRSFETEKKLQTTEMVSVRPTMNDVERMLLCMEVPYTVGRVVALVLQSGDQTQRKVNYLKAKEYLSQLLQGM